MDNQDSQWLNRNGVQRAYPNYGITKPMTPMLSPLAESLGPQELGASDGTLTNRWWIVYQDGEKVFIRGAE